jgi:hypothetical protein
MAAAARYRETARLGTEVWRGHPRPRLEPKTRTAPDSTRVGRMYCRRRPWRWLARNVFARQGRAPRRAVLHRAFARSQELGVPIIVVEVAAERAQEIAETSRCAFKGDLGSAVSWRRTPSCEKIVPRSPFRSLRPPGWWAWPVGEAVMARTGTSSPMVAAETGAERTEAKAGEEAAAPPAVGATAARRAAGASVRGARRQPRAKRGKVGTLPSQSRRVRPKCNR